MEKEHMLTANAQWKTVVHKSYLLHPRLLVQTGSRNLLIWPCGDPEHMLHTSINFIQENYVREDVLKKDVIPAHIQEVILTAAMLETKEEALALLLDYKDIFTRICEEAPSGKLFPV